MLLTCTAGLPGDAFGLSALRALGWRNYWLSWDGAEAATDGEPPWKMAILLSRAMTRNAMVAFFSATVPEEASMAWTVTGSGFQCRLRARHRWFFQRDSLGVRCSAEPETVALLFDDAVYHWTMQSQAAVFSPAGRPPPPLNYEVMRALFETSIPHDTFQAVVDETKASAVSGLLIPGVDGAVAGVAMADAVFEAAFLEALEVEAKHAGVRFTGPGPIPPGLGGRGQSS
ncbi:MAG TPA: hypothetical protein VGO11_27575 [Chthoniobacteraceae bacterium]|nr:hypothetical protein [Chthoniobacteraceae bacterium]